MSIEVFDVDEVYIKIKTTPDIEAELSDHFSFRVENAGFKNRYFDAKEGKWKQGRWDGRIRLYNKLGSIIPKGLLPRLEQFARKHKYEFVSHVTSHGRQETTPEEIVTWVEAQGLPMVPRDFQIKSLYLAVKDARGLFVCPTASGKSFIANLIVRKFDKTVLIIVPTTNLVSQMASDFVNYGYDSEDIHTVMAGINPVSDCKVTISTWQSLVKMKKEFFDKFEVLIGDEAHLYTAESLKSIMGKMVKTKYRFGLSGTLKDTKVHKLTLEGYFGTIHQITTTRKLINRGLVSDLDIKAILFEYPDEHRYKVHDMDYNDERLFVSEYAERNKFIINLAKSLKGNTLILFQLVEKHGKVLFEALDKQRENVYYIYGGVDTEDREAIRAIVDTQNDAIVVGSYGTVSHGWSVNHIHNIIFAGFYKSKIKVLQSIGRGLRLGERKEKLVLYDIADDLSLGSHKNASLKHFEERCKTYTREEFPYKIYRVQIK